MTRSRVFVFLACLLAATVLTIGSAPNAGSLSVGDFTVMIANRLGADTSTTPVTPEKAVEMLAGLGIQVTADSSAPLTEEEAAQILGQFGIKIQAGSTGDLLDEARANALLSIFGETLVSTTSKTVTGLSAKAVNSSTKNSVGAVLENTLEQCQQLPHDCGGANVPDGCLTCKKCCAEIFPPGGGAQSAFCAKACQKKNLASATDPTP